MLVDGYWWCGGVWWCVVVAVRRCVLIVVMCWRSIGVSCSSFVVCCVSFLVCWLCVVVWCRVLFDVDGRC